MQRYSTDWLLLHCYCRHELLQLCYCRQCLLMQGYSRHCVLLQGYMRHCLLLQCYCRYETAAAVLLQTLLIDARLHQTLVTDAMLLQTLITAGMLLQILVPFAKVPYTLVTNKNFFFFPNATTCSYELSWSPSWLWRKCNRLLRLGRPWEGVTLSRWCEGWYIGRWGARSIELLITQTMVTTGILPLRGKFPW